MCVVEVSGVLGFLLYLSCIMGISLISLKPSENGYYVSLSYATAIYSYFSMTLANLFAVIGFILEVIFNNKFPTARFLDITLTITLCTLFSCNGMAKTKLMLKHLAILSKINNKYSITKTRTVEKRYLALCLGFSVFYISLMSLTIIKLVFTAEDLQDYIYLSLAYPNIQVFTLETLMIILKYKVHEALKNIKEELENHLSLLIFDQPTVVSTQICIRNIGSAYVSVCKVIHEMNERDGKIILFLITVLVFYTIYATCDVIYRVTSDNNTFLIVYDLLWVSSFVIRLSAIFEPCHHITEEAGKIRVCLCKLMCHTTAVGEQCSWEWDVLLKQLHLLETTFTPFGMLTLDRTLLTTIIGVTTTYLAIAIPHMKTIYKNMTFN